MRQLATAALLLLLLPQGPALVLGLPYPTGLRQQASSAGGRVQIITAEEISSASAQVTIAGGEEHATVGPFHGDAADDGVGAGLAKSEEADLSLELAELESLRARLAELAEEVHVRERWLVDVIGGPGREGGSVADCDGLLRCLVQTVLRKAKYAAAAILCNNNNNHDNNQDYDPQPHHHHHHQHNSTIALPIPLPPWRGGASRPNATSPASTPTLVPQRQQSSSAPADTTTTTTTATTGDDLGLDATSPPLPLLVLVLLLSFLLALALVRRRRPTTTVRVGGRETIDGGPVLPLFETAAGWQGRWQERRRRGRWWRGCWGRRLVRATGLGRGVGLGLGLSGQWHARGGETGVAADGGVGFGRCCGDDGSYYGEEKKEEEEEVGVVGEKADGVLEGWGDDGGGERETQWGSENDAEDGDGELMTLGDELASFRAAVEMVEGMVAAEERRAAERQA